MQAQVEAMFTSLGPPFTRAGQRVLISGTPGRRTKTRHSVFCAQFWTQLPLTMSPGAQVQEHGLVHVSTGAVSQVITGSGISAGGDAAA